MDLSVLIITKNEEKNIRACLESVKWANEIVIIDSYSQDATLTICKEYTDKIILQEWQGYSAQKNIGHAHCKNNWILSIDADERVSPTLHEEIEHVIKSNQFSAYRIFIRDYMFGKWIEYGSWPQQCHIRLYHKNAAAWQSAVHEKLVIQGDVGILTSPLLHYSHLTINKFMMKMNTYTDIEARRWYEEGIRKNWSIIIFSSIRIFCLEYIQRQGFRDKGHGFVLAILMSVYHFLARIKLWELWYKHDRGISQ